MTTPLPPLREELSLHQGPCHADGSPTWILRDAVRGRFFGIGWAPFEMLARWHLGNAEAVAAQVASDTTIAATPGDVTALAQFLSANQLTKAGSAADTARLARIAAIGRQSWHQWLLHHYLFFRVPLVRPDRFLGHSLAWVRWLGGTGFCTATLAALVLGVVMLARQWDQFTATLLDTFTWWGVATYGGALAAAKVVHELAHAYTARAKGCRVPTMGIAFLVMWPVLYTDVNESWLLPRRRDRLEVAAAGVWAELCLAAWATLAWSFLPDGPLRQATFVLAAATWVSSLAINLSPFMRFDGYFLLMDALNLPNLHERSFALARWRLRELLFRLGDPPPERFSPGRERALVLFAWAVWIYRLVLFLGIAVLVYHFAIKLVGILLFAVEIGWFVALPIGRETMEWWRRRDAVLKSRRWMATLAVIAALAAAAAVPWPGGISAPAVLKAGSSAPIHAPAPARIDKVVAVEGQRVAAGQILFTLSSPDLDYRRRQVETRITVLQQEFGAVGFDPGLQRRAQALREELEMAVAERLALEREAGRMSVAAPTAGTVRDVMFGLTPGQWIGPRDRLAVVVGEQPAAATAYVPEADVERIVPGTEARFVADAGDAAPVDGTVALVERTTIRQLDVAALGAPSGGPIAVRAEGEALVPERSLYRAHIATTAPAPAHELRGTATFATQGISPLAQAWRAALAVLVRESGM